MKTVGMKIGNFLKSLSLKVMTILVGLFKDKIEKGE